jgi:methylated-DNA-[protein]-cysteine S-methyltransferase
MTLSGTQFQVKVWKAIFTIPTGEVRTYKEIAVHIGHPKAYRAVATACRKNPLPIQIPCHRVITSNGKIGDYLGEKDSPKKIALLKTEGFKV